MGNVTDSYELVHLNIYEHKMFQDSNKNQFVKPFLYQSYSSKKPKSILFKKKPPADSEDWERRCFEKGFPLQKFL